MANGLRSLSESQLQQCRLAFKFLDEERSGVLQVKTSLGHFTRLAGFCPREQQLRELMEKLENRKVRCLNFEKAIDVVGEELLRLGCHSMDMFDSIQEALKLLDASHLDEVPSGPPSDIVSLARLRSALVSSDDERSAKVFDRMLEEMGYSGDEEAATLPGGRLAHGILRAADWIAFEGVLIVVVEGTYQVDVYGLGEKLLGLTD